MNRREIIIASILLPLALRLSGTQKKRKFVAANIGGAEHFIVGDRVELLFDHYDDLTSTYRVESVKNDVVTLTLIR